MIAPHVRHILQRLLDIFNIRSGLLGHHICSRNVMVLFSLGFAVIGYHSKLMLAPLQVCPG